MSPQQDSVGQSRSASLTGEPRPPARGDTPGEKKMKSLAQRRQSAPSLVITKAFNKSRTLSRESCLSPVSPELCSLVQSIIGPNRAFVMEGHAQLKTGLQTQERHLFLFNDIFVIAKSKSASHFKLKNRAQICEMWTASCLEEVCEGSTSPDRSFVMGWPTTNCVATFSTTEQKEKWLSFLQRFIKQEKEKQQFKSTPLKIITRNVGSCAHSKVLTVNNTDTANDVVAMALQQFAITGSTKDYQLWVNSGKEDAPYPLIGHEYPFSIKMSHVREAAAQTQGCKDSIFPLDLQGSFIIEQLPMDMQCQFTLKPTYLASSQQITEPSQKQFKRKRSIMSWAFWRGSTAQLDSMPLSPTSLTPGRLFGLPLLAICDDDNLPKPIMDMLSFLFHEGPFTRGIFRRSANAKACKELKEKLNSGTGVHLASESVFVTAAVFKDFLRNIPGSIFSAELYNSWMTAMERGSHKEKIKEIQRLLELLPRVNNLLLHHVFGVLHSIEQQAEENQMNAFNLAVCIAPSILWPPTPCSPEIESESTKKVAVFVQFLIENCRRIFGNDFTCLIGDLPTRKCESTEDGSDVSSFQMHDSSYDSLENELNDDTDSPLSDLITKRSQENRSRDSVLTWSDCDLDQPEDEGVQKKVPLITTAWEIPSGGQHKPPSCELSDSEPLSSNTSGYSTSEWLTVPRRHRRSSEPSIAPPAALAQLGQNHESVIRKTSCDAVMTRSDDSYITQLRMLQIEGQKLINRSLNMGIDLDKTSNNSHKRTQKGSQSRSRLQPPPPLKLNIPSTASCSSLSSPGSSPSGSSMSSLDSAFSHNSECSVFTPSETFAPSCSVIQAQKSQPSTPTTSSLFKHFSGLLSPGPASGATSLEKHKKTCGAKEESSKCIAERNPVTLHPNSWLKKSGTWTLRRKEKGSKQEDKRGTSLKASTADSQVELSVASPGSGSCHTFFEEQKDVASSNPMARGTVQSANRSPPSRPPSYQEAIRSPLLNTVSKEKASTVPSRQWDHIDSPHSQQHLGVSKPCRSPTHSTGSEMPPPQTILDQIPQTVFYGQNSSLCLQAVSRPQSRSFTLGEGFVRRAGVRRCSESVSAVQRGFQSESQENICEPAAATSPHERSIKIYQEKQLSPASDRRNGPHMTNQELKSRCPVTLSSNAARAVKEYFLQTDVENCLLKTQEVTEAVIHSKKEWQKKHCNNRKFEDFEQVFFSEESYV
ncbi:rho GTPase-activating protein 20 isoform X1 [Callorhinchus milii]|uniref:rho GTPase-activating protein 20 isoform X1 n=2 Tax=Callorhinchus milii TaxID=7868 RepID=UPI001C3F50E0|nr:rho GTPase-activating protein 20 isoform X1 [Callorhinchus milii]